VKIYVAAVEALTYIERQDETQFTTKFDGFSEFHPLLNANVLFCRFKKKSHPVYDQTLSGLWCCVCLILQITLLYLEVSNHNLMRQVHLPFYTGLIHYKSKGGVSE
jgi:hypothetical protein